MSDFDESILSNDEELTFSREQIEYLRDEFERQKRWINLTVNEREISIGGVRKNSKLNQLQIW